MKRLCATLLTLVWGLSALADGKSETIVYINGAKYYIHTVRTGETLYGLSKTYGVGEQVIVENNPSIARGLKADENIRIPFVAGTQIGPETAQDVRFPLRGEGRDALCHFASVRDPGEDAVGR